MCTCWMPNAKGCYNELFVTHKNQLLFLLSGSKIFTKTGIPKDYNELLPTVYKIHNTCYCLIPKPVESPPTNSTTNNTTVNQTNMKIHQSLSTSGIYISEDYDRFCDHIMFSMEKPSMLNTIARSAIEQEISAESFSMLNLLNEKSLDQITESASARIWQEFMTFGSASARVLDIYGCKIRETSNRYDYYGYVLHSIYGWSLHQLRAIWTSVTNLLLYLGSEPREETTAETYQSPYQSPSNTRSYIPQNPDDRRLGSTNPSESYEWSA